MGELPDIVIPVRPGEHNPELRWALRSLVNVPHRTVWIAGYMPAWVREVRCIPTTQVRTKHENAITNLVAACRHPAVSERFVLWNDDIYLLEPIDEVPVLHRGTFAEFLAGHEHLGASAYMRGMRTTGEILERMGYPDPLCYELHVPLPMTKTGYLTALAAATSEGLPATRALQTRSVFANVARLGGRRAADVKVLTLTNTWERGELPFVSTVDSMWGRRHPAAEYVKALYDRPGPYETPLPLAARR